jgi:inosine-uridine nucleoside N-ribohydrolase
MKRRILITGGIVLGGLVFLFIIFGLGGPLWMRLGMKPICIQGEWPQIKVVTCGGSSAVSPTVTPLPLTSVYGQVPIPLIVDDDGSPDGMVALLYFLNNPLFDVRAVTISNGEAHPDLFAGHIMKLLARMGREDIPIGIGRATPLEGDNAFPDPWRQASDNFWEIPLPQASVTLEPVSASELIVETIHNSPQPVRLFISGTHTNLAEALRLDPGITENIRDVYIMGGSVYVPGNIKSDWPSIDNNVAEWNIWVDPVAAREVLASGLSLHLVPLDATRQVLWTESDLPGWISSKSPEGELAGNLLRFMLKSWSVDGVYVWDLVAAVHATTPAVCPEVSLAMEIVTTPGTEQGRTAVTQYAPNVAVCLEPDAGQIKSIAATILGTSD